MEYGLDFCKELSRQLLLDVQQYSKNNTPLLLLKVGAFHLK